MRGRIIALLAAGTLVVGLAGTASAAQIKPVGPTFVTEACLEGTGLTLIHTWTDQTVATGEPRPFLRIDVTFKIPGWKDSDQFVNFIDAEASGYGTWEPLGYLEAPWSAVKAIASSASGAFTATAKTIRQPKGGWPAC